MDRAVMLSSVPVKDKIVRCFAFKLIQVKRTWTRFTKQRL